MRGSAGRVVSPTALRARLPQSESLLAATEAGFAQTSAEHFCGTNRPNGGQRLMFGLLWPVSALYHAKYSRINSTETSDHTGSESPCVSTAKACLHQETSYNTARGWAMSTTLPNISLSTSAISKLSCALNRSEPISTQPPDR